MDSGEHRLDPVGGFLHPGLRALQHFLELPVIGAEFEQGFA